jgi:hypothetical protein
VIVLEFEDKVAKDKALLKLKDTMYRQDSNPDYIYKVVRVNDGG